VIERALRAGLSKGWYGHCAETYLRYQDQERQFAMKEFHEVSKGGNVMHMRGRL